MKTILNILIPLFVLTSCTVLTTNKKTNCSCCDKTYSNIDSALKCGSDPNEYKSLLFAFVYSDIEKNQQLGWAILKDQDIIETAKRDYVLIIIDPTKIILSENNGNKEFNDIIKQKRNETYFVVTNHVLYPYREFTLQTNKDKIIDDLSLGEGP